MLKFNKIYCGDCFNLIDLIDENSVDLVVTSPPYADLRNYGEKFNIIKPDDYVDWLLPINDKIFRVLKSTGSFIINIGDKVVNRKRHIYFFDYVVRSVKETKLIFYDRYIWCKKNFMPSGSKRRFNNNFEYIVHFVKDENQVKFNMDAVREPHSELSIQRYKYNIKIYDYKNGEKSIKNIKKPKFNKKGKAPATVMNFRTGCERGSKHPAPFHTDLSDFFIKALTDKNDLVLDPFMGSGTTAISAINLGRKYIGFEINQNYIDLSNKRIKNIKNIRVFF